MKKIYLLFVGVIIYSVSFSQTKKIEHRSHSGTNKTFTTKGNSNFGLPPDYQEKKKKTDSLRKAKEIQDSLDKAKKADSLAKPKSKRREKKNKN